MGTRKFGESALGPVRVLTIGSAPGPALEVLDLGATVHRLWVTGGDGVRRNVVLGYGSPQEYLDGSDYLGAMIGRYANRIRDGRFELDGETVQLQTNDRGNALHGGPDGFDRRMWQAEEHTPDRLVLRLTSPGSDQGFPGELSVRARFETASDSVRVSLTATTDATTVVNLTSHAYFNLDGDATGSIGEQWLTVAAQDYLPADETGIPVARRPVGDTVFDLRRPARLADVMAGTGGVDHCFVLDGQEPAARLDSPATLTRMELRTDQPGVQVYTGVALDGTGRSSTGVPYEQGAGLALEAALFPDTPNRAEFGSAVLRPGDTYGSWVEWSFTSLPDQPQAH